MADTEAVAADTEAEATGPQCASSQSEFSILIHAFSRRWEHCILLLFAEIMAEGDTAGATGLPATTTRPQYSLDSYLFAHFSQLERNPEKLNVRVLFLEKL